MYIKISMDSGTLSTPPAAAVIVSSSIVRDILSSDHMRRLVLLIGEDNTTFLPSLDVSTPLSVSKLLITEWLSVNAAAADSSVSFTSEEVLVVAAAINEVTLDGVDDDDGK